MNYLPNSSQDIQDLIANKQYLEAVTEIYLTYEIFEDIDATLGVIVDINNKLMSINPSLTELKEMNAEDPASIDAGFLLFVAYERNRINYQNKAWELTIPHLDVLSRKKKRLARQDDYGVLNTEKWISELEYFYNNVLSPELVDLESSTAIALYNWCPSLYPDIDSAREEKREVLIEILDDCIEPEEDISDYSENILPEDYEYFCADILNECGWVAIVTKGSGDQGIDVIAEKNDFRLAIQCKKYSKPVGNKAVQEAYSGGAFYEANACAVVAPIEYTPSAIELADSLGVHLFHHDDLVGFSITTNES